MTDAEASRIRNELFDIAKQLDVVPWAHFQTRPDSLAQVAMRAGVPVWWVRDSGRPYPEVAWFPRWVLHVWIAYRNSFPQPDPAALEPLLRRLDGDPTAQHMMLSRPGSIAKLLQTGDAR